MLSEIYLAKSSFWKHTTHYLAEEVSEAARRSGEGLRWGEEADAHRQFHEQADTRFFRCRGSNVSKKPRQHFYRVEVEARGVYCDEVEARGVTGSAADHDKWGSCRRADKTRRCS